MFDKEVVHAGFWFPCDILLNQGWLFLTAFTSDVCLPVNGEENYRRLRNTADIATKWLADTIG